MFKTLKRETTKVFFTILYNFLTSLIKNNIIFLSKSKLNKIYSDE